MFIKQIVIEGVEGDVEIRRTESGAAVIADGVEGEVPAKGSAHERWGVAYNAARVICGTMKNGRPNATSSMVLEIQREIERVAGC